MKSLLIPPYLRDGDRMKSSPLEALLKREWYTMPCTCLRNQASVSRLAVMFFARSGPFAGSEADRLHDIPRRATDDPDVKAVLCSRGGYGMSRIVDRIDFSALKKQPKWYAGYSDITSLHMWLNGVCGIASLHAEMPLTTQILNIFRYAMRPWSKRCAVKLNRCEHSHEASVEVSGPVTGGNISLLYSLHGTPAA